MLVKAQQLLKKLLELLKKHYVFLACVIFILIGFYLVESSHRWYGETEGEIIGGKIIAGLKAVAGSILIGASLLSLAILKINSNK